MEWLIPQFQTPLSLFVSFLTGHRDWSWFMFNLLILSKDNRLILIIDVYINYFTGNQTSLIYPGWFLFHDVLFLGIVNPRTVSSPIPLINKALLRFGWVIKKLKANGLRQYWPELKKVICQSIDSSLFVGRISACICSVCEGGWDRVGIGLV